MDWWYMVISRETHSSTFFSFELKSRIRYKYLSTEHFPKWYRNKCINWRYRYIYIYTYIGNNHPNWFIFCQRGGSAPTQTTWAWRHGRFDGPRVFQVLKDLDTDNDDVISQDEFRTVTAMGTAKFWGAAKKVVAEVHWQQEEEIFIV